jgi:general nucleoside transport system permease protein
MIPKLVPRGTPSPVMRWLSPLLAVACTVITGLTAFAIIGHDPVQALYVFFVQPIRDVYGAAELAVKATPLILCATGLAIGFRANIWNIGAEGQLTLGAIAGGGMALAFHDSSSALLIPAMIVAGIVGGAAWAAIPAFLKTRFGTNEILVSLMLTYVATLLLSYLVHGPWKDPEGFNFPESRLFQDAALLPIIIEDTRLHIGAAITLFAVVAVWIMMVRTVVGYQIQVIGHAPGAARYAGFSEKGIVWLCLGLGGGLAGLAGMFEVAGPVGQLVPVISPGYGFTAIIVAFLGRLHPLGIVAAGTLMALSYLGGELAQMEMGMPSAVTGVFQGMLLFYLLACDVLVNYRLSWARPTAVTH